jgi:hypothetical protein
MSVDVHPFIVAIDFGTAYSKAVAARPPASGWASLDSIRPLPIGLRLGARNPLLMPSAAFVDRERLFFGPAAHRAYAHAEGQKREVIKSFKLLLSSADLQRSLELFLSPAADPTRSLRQRDIIIAYLAFLNAAIDDSMAAMGGDELRGAPRRFALALWRHASSAHLNLIQRLHEEALFIARDLGAELSDPMGVPMERMRGALDRARAAPDAPGAVSGVVSEAVAAAACHIAGPNQAARHLTVIDIGAGTTDFGAVVLGPPGSSGAALEIDRARRTLMMGGDTVDALILDGVLATARGVRTVQEKSALWRAMMVDIRDNKERLFADGRMAVRHHDQMIVYKLKSLESDADYKQLVAELKEAFRVSLNETAERAAADGANVVNAVAAGGGAYWAMNAKVMQDAKIKVRGVKASFLPVVPKWAQDRAFQGQLAPVFHHIAIAIGAAIAPENLMLPH